MPEITAVGPVFVTDTENNTIITDDPAMTGKITSQGSYGNITVQIDMDSDDVVDHVATAEIDGTFRWRPVMDEATSSLADETEKAVLVDFWASWCQPCRRFVPTLKQLAAKYADKGLTVVSISTDTDRETDWMYDRLVFRKTPMPEVISRLSRFYDVEFRVIDPVIMTYTFTGTFEDKPLFLVLDYMKISSGIANEITYYNDDNGTQSVVVLRK